jgi:hypothetical protein
MKFGQFENHDFPMPLQSHEIQDYLNEAQEKETREMYENFEKTELDRTELSSLIRNHASTVFATGAAETHPNGHVVNIPSTVWFPIEERCSITYTDCNSVNQTKNARVLPITHDEYNMNVNNPYAKPFEDLVWRMELGATGSYYKRHELITDGSITLNSYNLRYLKRPVDIDLINGVDSELDPTIHDHIIDRAVQIALQARAVSATQVVNQNQES